MSEASDEGRRGIGRIEAFSDGVAAIIITIMVLELKPPEQAGLDHLWRLWPTFLAYMLSYAYIGVYWVNHHRLFGYGSKVTNGLIWSNLGLLFTLSLVPFSTAYLGQQHFSQDATIVYLLTMLAPSLFYVWLQRTVRTTGVQGDAADTYHRQTLRKGRTATLIYILGVALTFVSPWLGIACAALVAILWFAPASPFDGLFESRASGHR